MQAALLTMAYHLLGFSPLRAVLGHLESWGHPEIISYHNYQVTKHFHQLLLKFSHPILQGKRG